MSQDDSVTCHLWKRSMVREDEFALAVVFEGLTPGGICVNMVEDHDVAVA